jgi:hypothetical protein
VISDTEAELESDNPEQSESGLLADLAAIRGREYRHQVTGRSDRELILVAIEQKHATKHPASAPDHS